MMMRHIGLALLVFAGLSACGEYSGAGVPNRNALTLPNHPNSVVAQKVADTPVSYPYTFVLMADPHGAPGEPVFTALLDQILALTPTPVFVAVIGDFTETGTVPEILAYLDIVDTYPIPLFSIIGNHEEWAPVEQSRANYAAYFGAEDFSFDFAKARFVALNDIVIGADGLTNSQMQWMNKRLNHRPHPDRYILMHQPPPIIPPPWGPPPFQNEQNFYNSVAVYNVRLVASGHIHEFRHLQSGNAHYLVTGGSGGYQGEVLDNPPNQGIFKHFLLVTVQADGNSRVEVYKLGESAPDPAYTVQFQTTVQ